MNELLAYCINHLFPGNVAIHNLLALDNLNHNMHILHTCTVYWEIFEVQNFRGLVILKFFVNKFFEDDHLDRKWSRARILIFEA